MEKFDKLEGVAAPLRIVNVDTDMIIPKQYLKTLKRTGLAKGLFSELRYKDDGSENPDFVLNKPAYRKAKILVADNNFGCGSSREHAPWALMDYGIRCVISTQFGDIFYNNCFKNGVLPIKVSPEDLEKLFDDAERGANATLSIDLEKQEIRGPDGGVVKFDIDPHRKHCMLNGLDDIGLTKLKQSQDRQLRGKVQGRAAVGVKIGLKLRPASSSPARCAGAGAADAAPRAKTRSTASAIASGWLGAVQAAQPGVQALHHRPRDVETTNTPTRSARPSSRRSITARRPTRPRRARARRASSACTAASAGTRCSSTRCRKMRSFERSAQPGQPCWLPGLFGAASTPIAPPFATASRRKPDARTSSRNALTAASTSGLSFGTMMFCGTLNRLSGSSREPGTLLINVVRR